MAEKSYRFNRFFALGTVGSYLTALAVLALMEAAARFGLSVYRFSTEGEARAEVAAGEIAVDVRDIMVNRGGPVAARTVYPILESIYDDAGYRIAIEPTQETVSSIEATFGFTPRGIPADWPEGRFQQGRVEMRADDFCLQCHIDSQVGSVLGTVTVRHYLATELAGFWRDTQVLGLVAMANVILASGLMFFYLRRRMRPLQALDEAIGDLGKSGVALTRRVPVLSRDEFGKLAHDTNMFLDRMAGSASDMTASSREMRRLAERLAAARRKIERQSAGSGNDVPAAGLREAAEALDAVRDLSLALRTTPRSRVHLPCVSGGRVGHLACSGRAARWR